MTEEEGAAGQLTIREALRLKHGLGKAITWRGLNASEVLSFTETSPDRWRKVRQGYEEWYYRKGVSGFGLSFPVAILAIGAGMYFLMSGGLREYGGAGALLGVGWLMWRLARRQAHREGYFEGYEAGLEEGVYRALGVSDDEVHELGELARGMELDAHILERLKGHEKPDAE